jgi:hypothetical protein
MMINDPNSIDLGISGAHENNRDNITSSSNTKNNISKYRYIIYHIL